MDQDSPLFFCRKKTSHQSASFSVDFKKYFMPSPNGLRTSPIKNLISNGSELDIRLPQIDLCQKFWTEYCDATQTRSVLVGTKANSQLDIRIS